MLQDRGREFSLGFQRDGLSRGSHGHEIDERSAGFGVIDETRLTFLAGLNVLAHVPLPGWKERQLHLA